MTKEIKGYTFEEVAAREKNKLDAVLNTVVKRRQEIERQKNELEQEIQAYRVSSVNRVLEFICSGVERLEPAHISNLLCHCINKLNGNLDGIELTLKYDKEPPKKG